MGASRRRAIARRLSRVDIPAPVCGYLSPGQWAKQAPGGHAFCVAQDSCHRGANRAWPSEEGQHGRQAEQPGGIARSRRDREPADPQRRGRLRARAYSQAARNVASLTVDVADLQANGKLQSIPGVGPSIAAKIDELVRTGQLGYLEELRRDIAPEAAELLDVPGIGPAKARELYERLGMKSVADLGRAIESGKLATVPASASGLSLRSSARSVGCASGTAVTCCQRGASRRGDRSRRASGAPRRRSRSTSAEASAE